MEFRTERLQIRHWKESDCMDLYQCAKDPRVGRSAGWAPHKSEKESLGVIRDVLTHDECYAICMDGNVIGCIELYDHTRSNLGISEGELELGGWLAHDYWNEGLSTEAAKPVIDHAFDGLNCSRLFLPVYSENLESRQELFRLGFEVRSEDGCPELCSDVNRPGTVFQLAADAWHKRM